MGRHHVVGDAGVVPWGRYAGRHVAMSHRYRRVRVSQTPAGALGVGMLRAAGLLGVFLVPWVDGGWITWPTVDRTVVLAGLFTLACLAPLLVLLLGLGLRRYRRDPAPLLVRHRREGED